MKNDTFQRVVDCIAATTRYPVSLLTAAADMENDLGIDSVKNLEIVLALADEFSLDLASEGRDPAIRTVSDVANWIDGFLPKETPAVSKSVESNAVSQPPRSPVGYQARETSSPPRTNGQPSNSAKAPQIRRVDAAHNGAPAPQLPIPPSARPLNGKIAFVTGSGRGVGRTIARVLAARGATVVVNSFHSRDAGEETVAEIISQGGNAVHIWGSVANPEHVDRMFREVEEQFGRLDILVCNASDGKIGSFMDLSSDDWDRAFRTNVSGHHQCAVKAAKLMQLRGGSIITMSAVGADRYIDGLGSQGVVKAAVETLTRYLACELGRYGIRVNCVAGGPVYGELLSKFPAAAKTQEHWEAMTPDGELCNPMDLANAVGFLVSDEATGINGSVWMVDHGFSAIADGRSMRSGQRV